MLCKRALVDDNGIGQKGTFPIVVHGVNTPPVITSTPPLQAQKNSAYNYTVVASDPDGDPLTYSVSGHSGMAFSTTTPGLLTWTPTATGNYNVTVTPKGVVKQQPLSSAAKPLRIAQTSVFLKLNMALLAFWKLLALAPLQRPSSSNFLTS
jgi:hypothetical protein